MSVGRSATGRRVVVVSGGGAGIGAAIAEDLGRSGAFVVTMDPMVTVDGSAPLEATDKTTADRIVAAGGTARASNTSVTDSDGVRALFTGLIDEFGSLDAVVNAGGILRPTGFAAGIEDDWAAVLGVHLDGYLNVLRAALPIMAEAGHGRVIGVTSGSGWRPANAGAYSCAKRAVAALTWQIGRAVPSGVTVNALSPIAATRMVTSATSRPGGQPAGGGSTGGLSLGSMPPPGHLGPIGAYLASEEFSWCSGQIVFSSGTEAAVLRSPRLLEVARSRNVQSLAGALETLIPVVFTSAETHQATTGATNPRFGAIYDEPAGGSGGGGRGRRGSCLIVTDDAAWGVALEEALGARGVACVGAGGSAGIATGFDAAAAHVAGAAEDGPLDAIIVALVGARRGGGSSPAGWQEILDDHAGITDAIRADAGWARAVSDYAATADRPVRVVTITEATSSAGRTRAQAAAQLARASQPATADRVAAFAISVESDEEADRRAAAELAAYLASGGNTTALAGAELAAGPGWLGLRSHPAPAGSISYGGPAVPDWLDGVLRQMVAGHAP